MSLWTKVDSCRTTVLTDFEGVLRWVVSEGGSINLYMFHGGTNFGFTAGANDRLSATNESYIMEYSPVVTSYGESYIVGHSPVVTSYGESYIVGHSPVVTSYGESYIVGHSPVVTSYGESYVVGHSPVVTSYGCLLYTSPSPRDS